MQGPQRAPREDAMKYIHPLIAALLLAAPLQAAQAAGPQAPPRATPLPPVPVQQQEGLEPEVTIIQDRRKTVYEYRVAGRLYMVRVQPKAGPPYYFLDTDGDGQLDVRREGPGEEAVNQWVLFRW